MKTDLIARWCYIVSQLLKDSSVPQDISAGQHPGFITAALDA
jgi:hypothetical protein